MSTVEMGPGWIVEILPEGPQADIPENNAFVQRAPFESSSTGVITEQPLPAKRSAISSRPAEASRKPGAAQIALLVGAALLIFGRRFIR